MATNMVLIRNYYRNIQSTSVSNDQVILSDIKKVVKPKEYMITDNQFLAGLANKRVPAALVDTSSVRIITGYLTSNELIYQAKDPNITAILFYSGRLNNAALFDFRSWVSHNYRNYKIYRPGVELWVK